MSTEKSGITMDGFNDTVRSPNVLSIMRHFCRKNLDFSSRKLVEHLAAVPAFPLFSARDLLAAANAGGVELIGQKFDFSEISLIETPFLTYVESVAENDTRVQLMEVLQVNEAKAVVSDGPSGDVELSFRKLKPFWTGVVFLVKDSRNKKACRELEDYRGSVSVLPSMLTPDDCAELIDYCERLDFKRSRVLDIDARLNTQAGVISQKVRNSSSVAMQDRSHPLLEMIYKTVAKLEGVDESCIEDIQCVRYKRGQRFTSHFDAAVGVPRRMTYLLYLNHGFAGGETRFPMLDLDVKPVTGSCLRFPSCDDAGRVCWQSEHGGLPVLTGTKYALNIWVHTSSESAA